MEGKKKEEIEYHCKKKSKFEYSNSGDNINDSEDSTFQRGKPLARIQEGTTWRSSAFCIKRDLSLNTPTCDGQENVNPQHVLERVQYCGNSHVATGNASNPTESTTSIAITYDDVIKSVDSVNQVKNANHIEFLQRKCRETFGFGGEIKSAVYVANQKSFMLNAGPGIFSEDMTIRLQINSKKQRLKNAYQIGNFWYPTKKTVEAEYSGILNFMQGLRLVVAGPHASETEAQVIEFLLDGFDMHGKDVISVELRKNGYCFNFADKTFEMQLGHGKFRKIVYNESSKLRRVKDTARASIFEQVQAFKSQSMIDSKLQCMDMDCENRSGDSKFEIDHGEGAPFDLIFLNFLKSGDYDIEKLYEGIGKSTRGDSAFKYFEPAVDQAWKKFHAENWKPKVLCVPCHRKKSKLHQKETSEVKKQWKKYLDEKKQVKSLACQNP